MNAAQPSTIWLWGSGARLPRAPISCRSVSPRIGCGSSATARSSRSSRGTARRRSRRTAARISSSLRSELMRLKSSAAPIAVAAVLAVLAGSPVSLHAANKEHQQLMADLRMLQEQAQLLQNLIGSVTEALKAVNTRLDQQAETNRKAFADQ